MAPVIYDALTALKILLLAKFVSVPAFVSAVINVISSAQIMDSVIVMDEAVYVMMVCFFLAIYTCYIGQAGYQHTVFLFLLLQ